MVLTFNPAWSLVPNWKQGGRGGLDLRCHHRARAGKTNVVSLYEEQLHTIPTGVYGAKYKANTKGAFSDPAVRVGGFSGRVAWGPRNGTFREVPGAVFGALFCLKLPLGDQFGRSRNNVCSSSFSHGRSVHCFFPDTLFSKIGFRMTGRSFDPLVNGSKRARVPWC